MGAYLDAPLKDKNPEGSQNADWKWGACAMQGWRCGMEDTHVAFLVKDDPNRAMVFGVFDGHGGKEVAEFCKENIEPILLKKLASTNRDYELALKQTFFELDDKVKTQEYADMTGTTAVVVLITKDTIYCSNSGDSRAVLCRDGKAVALSYDHKPSNQGEKQRIEAASHFVDDERVDGNLALSRAIGDFQYKEQTSLPPEKQAVTCDPDILKQSRSSADEFIIVACDGIWDCKDNQGCVDFLKQKLSIVQNKEKKGSYAANESTKPLYEPLEELLDDCLAGNTDDGIGTDNMTAILAQIKY